MAENEVVLFSDGLLSKWGFQDGDVLDDLLWDWADAEGIDPRRIDEHAILVRLVREFLLPALNQRVEVEEIGTMHNPIRAATVNGAEVPWDVITGERPVALSLTPEHVRVPFAEVVRIARDTMRPEKVQ